MLLRGVAVAADLIHAEIGVSPVGEPDRCGSAGDFLHRHDVSQITHGGTAEFLFDSDAEEAQSSKLRPQLAREFIGAIDFRCAGGYLAAGEGRNRFPQNIGGLAEVEFEACVHDYLPEIALKICILWDF